MADELSTPVLIVGGGTGGVAAALAIAETGGSCVLIEPGDRLGGQLTAQAVPPDENRWVEPGGEVQGCNASYQRFRQGVRDWYRQHRRLTPAAHADPRLNPGGGWVSRLCYEPAVGQAVLEAMLEPHVASGRVRLMMRHAAIEADVEGDSVQAVTFLDEDAGRRVTVQAEIFLDATELGDLLPITGCEHRIGAESQRDTGELHALAGDADPMDQQAITWVFAAEHRPGEDFTGDPPAGYDRWAAFVPQLTPPWPGPLFSWTICGEAHAPRHLAMVPWPDEPAEGELELWRYRRVVDRAAHAASDADAPPADVTLVNWVQNDYFRRPTLGVDPAAQLAAFDDAKAQSLCLLHWLRTAAPRHDGGHGYPGLRLAPHVMGTTDGFAAAPYIREARRLEAQLVLSEAHVGADQRRAAGHADATPLHTPAGERFDDTVAIGHYPIDLHPSTSGRNQVYVEACPFHVPLRSLLPVRLTNLIAAGKCLGVTHVANGCTRLHPVEWAIGEAAGTLAALARGSRLSAWSYASSPGHVETLHKTLADAGVPLAWPW